MSDIMRERDEYRPPKIRKGDEVKVGKFKNRKAEVTGFDVDTHGQPVLKTTKGDQKLFKPRISKLEPKVNERTEDEVEQDEISLVITAMQNLISRYKRSHLPAADLYHDVQMKGQLVDWMQENFVPIWERHGYPPVGQPAWGEVEREVIERFLINK